MGGGAAGDGAANGNGMPAPGAVVTKTALVGCSNFKRHNPLSDRFKVHRFHHIEFWCADATNTYKR